MNGKCEFDKNDIIARYQLDILNEDEKCNAEEHLKNCEICQNTLSELNSIAEALSLMSVKELPEGFKESLHNRLIREQKLIYAESGAEKTEKPKYTEILKGLFPLRRLVPLAAMLAVVLLLSGKLGFLNVNDSNEDDNSDVRPIAVERINKDIASEIKPYSEEENTEVNSENEDGSENSDNVINNKSEVMKIHKNDNNLNSKDTTVALNVGSDTENNVENNTTSETVEENKISDLNNENNSENNSALPEPRAILTEKNSEEVTEESTADYGNMLMYSLDGSPVLGSGNSSENSENSAADVNSPAPAAASVLNEGKEDSTGAISGGGGSVGFGVSGMNTTEGVKYYIDVYSLERSKIENSVYKEMLVQNDNGIYELCLTDDEYNNLCTELSCTPKFVQTKVMDTFDGYNVIIEVY